MAAQNTFQLQANTRLYQQATEGLVAVFVTGSDALPDTLSVADALANVNAMFVILNEALPNENAALQQVSLNLKALFESPRAPDIRVYWIDDAMQENPVIAMYTRIQQNSVNWVLPESSVLTTLGQTNVKATLVMNATVSADTNGLIITPPQGRSHQFTMQSETTPKSVQNPCAGPAFMTLLNQPGNGVVSDPSAFAAVLSLGEMSYRNKEVTDLQVSQRFFIDSQFAYGWLESVAFGPFNLIDSQSLRLRPSLDFWRPLSQERSRLTCISNDPVTSNFKTPVGTVLNLSPVPGSALAFYNNRMASPIISSSKRNAGTSFDTLYLAPIGGFEVSTQSGSGALSNARFNTQLIAGSSAIEYFSPENTSDKLVVYFSPNGNAYLPDRTSSSNNDVGASDCQNTRDETPKKRYGAPENYALTSWCVILSSTAGTHYFAQPEASPLFEYVPLPQGQEEIDPISSPTVFYPFVSPVAGSISHNFGDVSSKQTLDAEPNAFPMVALAGLYNKQNQANALAFDQQVFAPIRRAMIPAYHPAKQELGLTPQWATSPQGLLLKQLGSDWQELNLANALTDPNYARDGKLKLFNVRSDLKSALLNNQLFLAITDQQQFTQLADLYYELTADDLQALQNIDKLPQALADKLKPLTGNDQYWIGESAYYQAIASVLGPIDAPTWAPRIYARSVQFALKLGGQSEKDAWPFNLAPYDWNAFGSILVFKFLPQSLEELVADTSSWTLPNVFNRSQDSTRSSLAKYIENAKNGADPELRRFYLDVASNKHWQGILAINMPVPLNAMPEELKGLAAGIDASQFKAHHIAISVSSLKISSSIEPIVEPTNINALINYVDPEPHATVATPYDYRVENLKVIIRQSQLIGFSSQVALYINSLFGDLARINDDKGYIQLNGSYQSDGDTGSYIFISTNGDDFVMTSAVLDTAVLNRAQFVTLRSDDPSQAKERAEIHTQFLLSGFLNFKDFPEFDPLSFGDQNRAVNTRSVERIHQNGLAFSGLTLDMSFNINIPSYKTFSFNPTPTVLDASASQARKKSLYQNFPLKLSGLLAGASNNRPDKNDFMPVYTPLSSDGLSDSWYGVEYKINLGSPGALAAKIDFTAKLVVAWSPGNDASPKLFVGLSLPGVKGGENTMSLQGVIKLKFGDVRFNTSNDGERREYVLALRNIVLSILGVSLPKNALIDMLIFGDSAGSNRNTVGWYASYKSLGFDVNDGLDESRPLLNRYLGQELDHEGYPRLESHQSCRLPQEPLFKSTSRETRPKVKTGSVEA